MKLKENLVSVPVRVEVPSDADAFHPVLLSPAPHHDSELADLIEQDGRSRLDRGMPCQLDRYYAAVPDLVSKPIALDAAIDISLRSLAMSDGCSSPQEKHAECLLRSYPELSGPIRLAALLNNQLVTTTGVGGRGSPRRKRNFPERIGPRLEDGRPRYELLRPLGRGSSGTVCEAVDHLLSDSGHAAKVAVKLVPVDPATAQRQTAEATKARRVEHPGVVRVLDRGLTDSEELFLVYELVGGGDLQSWFDERSKSIPPRRAVEIIAQVAAGVQAAHSAGLVHCDLKPSNIFLTRDGSPRVGDFGVSAITDAFPGMPDGAEGVPVGNLAFAAPEQVRRSAAFASPLVDVYALGGILYYLLSGTLPNGSTPEEVARNHHPVEGRQTPPSVRAITPEIDARLDSICAKAMHPRPEDRYSTAAELAADLNAYLGNLPIRWLRESKATHFKLWLRRSPGAAGLLAACIGLLVIGGFASGYFAQNARHERELAAAIDKTLQSSNKYLEDIARFYDSPEGQKLSEPEKMEYFIRHLKDDVSPHPIQAKPPSERPSGAPAAR